MLKGAISSLTLLLAMQRSLIMMKNAFYITLKAVFVLKIFKFLSQYFDHVEKWLDYKDKVNFKIYDATNWIKNNCNTHSKVNAIRQ